MRYLFVDLTNQREIKILNADVKRSINIASAYYLKIPEGESPVLYVARKLEEEKLTTIPVVLIPSRDMIGTQTLEIPVMPDKEIRKVIPREVAKLIDSDEPIVFDFLKGVRKDLSEEKQIEVIYHYAKKKEIWELLESFKKHEIRPVKILPEIGNFETFLETSGFTSKPKEGSVFIDVMPGRINMNIFYQNLWSLNREFLFKMEPETALEDEDYARISTEFSRTFQYFKQKNKSASIDDAYIFGSNKDINEIHRYIEESQPLNAIYVDDDTLKDKIIFPPTLKDKKEFLSLFFGSIAAAHSVVKKGHIDLYPKEYFEKEKFPKQLFWYSTVFIIIVAILIAATIFMSQSKSSFKTDLEKDQKVYNSLKTQIDHIFSIRKKRKSYFEKILVMDFPKIKSFHTANFIRELSLILDNYDQVVINEIEMQAQTRMFEFFIDGKIKADNINDALAAFDQFLDSIKNYRGIDLTTFTPPESSVFVTEKQQKFWKFVIEGKQEIDWEQSSDVQ